MARLKAYSVLGLRGFAGYLWLSVILAALDIEDFENLEEAL